MADIFAEKVWHFLFFRWDEKYGTGSMRRPDQVGEMIQHFRATRYEVKSWRGTYDKEVYLDAEETL